MSQGISGACVEVILLKNNKIVLGKRAEKDPEGVPELHGKGNWTLPGGKIRFQESIEDTMKREVKEETDIDVKSFDVISVSNDRIFGRHFITIGVISKEFDGKVKTMEPEEITEWKWFSLDKLPSPMFPPSEKIIKNYMEKKFYRD